MDKEKKEVDEKYIKEIWKNIIKAIVIVVFFLLFNIAYSNIEGEYFKRGTQIFTIIFLFLAIYFFEKAYKKDNGKMAIEGIEILILSSGILTTQYITNRFNFNIKSYALSESYIFAIYFVLKSIIIYTQGRKELEKSLSDIAEIVKKEVPIKKEATKKKKKETVEIKEENKNQIEKNDNKKIKNKRKNKNKNNKKRGKKK